MPYKWEQLTEEQIREAIESSIKYCEAAEKLGYSRNTVSGRNAVKAAAEKYNISLSHFLNAGAKDLRNQVFGELVAIEVDKEKKMSNGHLYWKCKCSCGNTLSVESSSLIRGETKSCGCRKYNFIDETGNKYDRLTVVKIGPRASNGDIQWYCDCTCGNRTLVKGTQLRSGKTKSCGCLMREKASENLKKYKESIEYPWNFQDLTGQQFGKLTVLEQDKTNDLLRVHWLCSCDCGSNKIISVSTDNLKSGRVSSCGCLRNQSKGNLRIKELLDRMQINYQQEYSFADLLGDTNVLYYDFAIFNSENVLFLLIEYQGEQHYRPIEFFGGEKLFQRQQKYDQKKRDYCINNNLRLIEIPYWDYNKLSEEYIKKLIKGV